MILGHADHERRIERGEIPGPRLYVSDLLQTLGTVALFGQSSGPVPPFDLSLLARGSYFITRPSLFHYVASRQDLLAAARALFDVVLSGAVKIEVRQTYPLSEAARAHRDLESRKTTGSTVLLP